MLSQSWPPLSKAISAAFLSSGSCIVTKTILNFMGQTTEEWDDGGGAGIRTLGGVTPTTVFETVPFNHSGTPPWRHSYT